MDPIRTALQPFNWGRDNEVFWSIRSIEVSVNVLPEVSPKCMPHCHFQSLGQVGCPFLSFGRGRCSQHASWHSTPIRQTLLCPAAHSQPLQKIMSWLPLSPPQPTTLAPAALVQYKHGRRPRKASSSGSFPPVPPQRASSLQPEPQMAPEQVSHFTSPGCFPLKWGQVEIGSSINWKSKSTHLLTSPSSRTPLGGGELCRTW